MISGKLPIDSICTEKENNMFDNRLKFKTLEVKGYKSIPSTGQSIDFGDITILLGANGSGKSNLVSFFKLLNCIPSKSLQLFIGKQGGADALLYYGSKHSDKIEFTVVMDLIDIPDLRLMSYEGKLVHGMPDRLFFALERRSFKLPGQLTHQELIVQSGNGESGFHDEHFILPNHLFAALSGIRTYQFHDTSDTAKIKSNGYINDSQYLRSDAGNLAAFLLAMQIEQTDKKYYNRIIRHIQKVMPQFKEFDLIPPLENKKTIQLNWRDTSGDTLFGPHQISDGSGSPAAAAGFNVAQSHYYRRT
jgi:predicted ATPase